jgi:branched-chain amino acid transport system substrate-binding protein
LYGILQKKVDDPKDTGLQFPILTDVAIKWGSRRSRNGRSATCRTRTRCIRRSTLAEDDAPGAEDRLRRRRGRFRAFARLVARRHEERANANGYTVLGESKWLLNDTNFSTQVREIKKANPDILSIAAIRSPPAGLLKEMQRQGVKPKLIVGLTSTSSEETMQGCPKQAGGHDHSVELRPGQQGSEIRLGADREEERCRRPAQHGRVGKTCSS